LPASPGSPLTGSYSSFEVFVATVICLILLDYLAGHDGVSESGARPVGHYSWFLTVTTVAFFRQRFLFGLFFAKRALVSVVGKPLLSYIRAKYVRA